MEQDREKRCCLYCAAELEEDAKFCPKCGRDQGAVGEDVLPVALGEGSLVRLFTLCERATGKIPLFNWNGINLLYHFLAIDRLPGVEEKKAFRRFLGHVLSWQKSLWWWMTDSERERKIKVGDQEIAVDVIIDPISTLRMTGSEFVKFDAMFAALDGEEEDDRYDMIRDALDKVDEQNSCALLPAFVLFAAVDGVYTRNERKYFHRFARNHGVAKETVADMEAIIQGLCAAEQERRRLMASDGPYREVLKALEEVDNQEVEALSGVFPAAASLETVSGMMTLFAALDTEVPSP